MGPVGIVIADYLFGEITPAMAPAIGQSDAKLMIIPVNHCGNIIVGVPELPIVKQVQNAVNEINALCNA